MLDMFKKTTAWKAEVFVLTKTLIDGQRTNGLLMQRKVDGQYEYREPTPEEEEEYLSQVAW